MLVQVLVAAAPRPDRPMSLARRTEAIEPFLAVEVAERAQQLEQQGVDVVHLRYGEPDFDAARRRPQAARAGAKPTAARATRTVWASLPLREAIVDHYRATYGVKISPDQVLVTPGTSPAMMLLFGALLDPGDEVVLSDPVLRVLPELRPLRRRGAGLRGHDGGGRVSVSAGGDPVAPGAEDPGDRHQLARQPDRDRAVGRAHGRPRGAGPRGRARGSSPTRSITDSRYGDGTASILEFTDRAFVLNGFSKAYAMTGWRLGWLIAPRRVHARTLQRLYGNFFISTNEFVQWAGVAALREATDETARFRHDLRRRGAA